MTHSLPTRLSFDIFTHEAVGLSDALVTCEGPVIELHISNPYAREEWRHTSVVAPVATGSICGLGGHGYALSVAAVARPLARAPSGSVPNPPRPWPSRAGPVGCRAPSPAPAATRPPTPPPPPPPPPPP